MRVASTINQKTRIYVLRHPVTLEIRYVGKTAGTLPRRLSNHLSDANRRRECKRYVINWIRRLRPLIPIIELICEVEGDGCAEECAYIHLYRESGYRLTNLTDGGDGVVGYKPVFTDEHRAKISASKMGHVVTTETKAKLSNALTGRKLTPEVCAKMSISKVGNRNSVGRKHSLETRARMSAAHKGHKYALGNKLTPEHKAKISARHKGNKYCAGRKLSLDHKTKISTANKGRQFSEETRARMSDAAKKREALKRSANP